MIADFPSGSIVLVDSSALVYLVEGEGGSLRRRAGGGSSRPSPSSEAGGS